MEDVAALFEPFRPRPLDPATLMARLSAASVDAISVLLVASVVALVFELLEKWIGLKLSVEYVWSLFFFAALVVSQLCAEMWLSTSLGKWLFNLVVVRADGASASRRALIARFLLRFPLIPLLLWPDAPMWLVLTFWALQILSTLAAFAAFVAWKGRTLSDLATKTRVVYRGRK
jgi:uncharacterized RDD family membrane protein YckC